MSAYPFRIVNVFTRDRASLSGNPLCVFETGAGLDEPTMQALALQFNLSETTFILPSIVADARVRIFTPNSEMPFAGHPTLGTAHVCRSLGLGGDTLRLEMKAGVIGVDSDGNRWTLKAPQPSFREFDAPLADLAAALGLTTRDIDQRPLWIKAGTEQLIVPLASEDAVRRTAPRMEMVALIRGDQGMGMVYVFAMRGAGKILSRFFFEQQMSLCEDPATGSATANLGGWCLAMQRSLPLRYEISQGEMVGRPSSLHLEVAADSGIRVSGDVIDVGSGVLTLT